MNLRKESKRKQEIQSIKNKHENPNNLSNTPFTYKCEECNDIIKENNDIIDGSILLFFKNPETKNEYKTKNEDKELYNLIKNKSNDISKTIIIHDYFNFSNNSCSFEAPLHECYPQELVKEFSIGKEICKLKFEEIPKPKNKKLDILYRLNIPYYEEARKYIEEYYKNYKGCEFQYNKNELKNLNYFLNWVYSKGLN
jgi:hypothetical protein